MWSPDGWAATQRRPYDLGVAGSTVEGRGMAFYLSGSGQTIIVATVVLTITGIGAAIDSTGESRQERAVPAIVGRWDLTVSDSGGSYPSWLEVTKSGHKTLVGRLVA